MLDSYHQPLQKDLVQNVKHLKLIISTILFAAAFILGAEIISISKSNQIVKQDYAEIGHIKYGLLSVDKWKEQVAIIVFDEMAKLNLTKANEKQLKKHVEVQLDGLIDNVESKIKESNKGTTKGWIKQSVMEALIDKKEIKKGIPGYADAIVIEMTKAQTERDVKNVLKKRIEQYFNETFKSEDLTSLNKILLKTGSLDIDNAKIYLEREIITFQKDLNLKSGVMIVLIILIFCLSGLSKKPIPVGQYILMLLSLLVLLLVGITIPMIDLEAKISEMSFYLLDHPVTFTNQILFFQSKSILDVFWVMLTSDSLQMKFVGILILTFSLFFPLLKMASSVAYYFQFRHAQNKSWIQFFVLKSGKWSMADVMTVAIFMAYIGFNGVISSQFGNLKSVDEEIVILTTNGTALKAGFYIFVSYTVLSLFFSGFLTRKLKLEPLQLHP